MTAEPLWLFADQLGPHVHATDEHRDREVVLIESTKVLHRKRFHRQKLHIVWSGMRHLAAELGDRATLLQTDTYRTALERVGRPVVVHEPTSHAALAFVERLRKEGLVAEILPTPTFALPRADFQEWAGDRETFRMEDFYRSQRRRFDVLMEGGEPVGGKWNYDHENREPPPQGQGDARGRRPLAAARGRDRRPGPRRPRRPRPAHHRDGRPALVRRHRRRGPARAGALRPPPPAALRAARGRHAARRLGDGALAAVRAAQPRPAAAARRRPRGRGGVPDRRRTAGQRRGLHPAGDRLARVHLAPVLALRARLPREERPARPHAAARLVRASWTPTP